MRITLRKPEPSRAAAAAALALSCLLPCAAQAAAAAPTPPSVLLSDGIVEGMRVPAFGRSMRAPTVKVFRGIPYAAPPVGEFRWREPQPVARWAGVRPARQFGPSCMQLKSSKRDTRATGMSEDCLYLNVWTPDIGENNKRPVLVYFHGGGFAAGDGSEARYDGAELASRGIVVVTVNYRLGAFGFLALPEAASESSHGATGNYGLLDQAAALRWVRNNITKFGGDPDQVTIAGNSAGSVSVSAHMTSPVSRGLFARAIGESGAAFGSVGFKKRDEAEHAATQFAAMLGGTSLQQLRAVPADKVLAATKTKSTAAIFWPTVDGHFVTESPESIYSAGQQASVPLMLGSNSQEAHFTTLLGDAAPTPENWRQTVTTMFPGHAQEVLAHYPGNDNNEVMHAATALAGDLFVGNSAWRWMQSHLQGGHAPVYYYRYTQPRPPATDSAKEQHKTPQPTLGAAHSAEVEYALGNLQKQRRYAWTAVDYDVSRIFSGYVEQFVKTGNPNGTASAGSGSDTAIELVQVAAEPEAPAPVTGGAQQASASRQAGMHIPVWPAVRADNRGILRQVIGENTHLAWDREGPRQGLVQRLLESRGGSGPRALTSLAPSSSPAAPAEQ
ncbi:para-nitrobenzyl esterase [Trinickia symbiotica]|uniref:Carboxylic ester hydrolase n=1 Tax=Trinickia symbiotica TaxID=863227 RepID=A0A2N7X7C5_9BURK|nr:carboxylesterase family protein [Trinickia symbiotica]PMS37669.1 carboxylesterase family protein [Trinickia symbiotica]PPK44208.1 para-nitrobenzyl esterase [Trinickia symbiotica]